MHRFYKYITLNIKYYKFWKYIQMNFEKFEIKYFDKLNSTT